MNKPDERGRVLGTCDVIHSDDDANVLAVTTPHPRHSICLNWKPSEPTTPHVHKIKCDGLGGHDLCALQEHYCRECLAANAERDEAVIAAAGLKILLDESSAMLDRAQARVEESRNERDDLRAKVAELEAVTNTCCNKSGERDAENEELREKLADAERRLAGIAEIAGDKSPRWMGIAREILERIVRLAEGRGK